MPTHDRGIDAQEPLVVRRTAAETGGEYVRFEFVLYPRETPTENCPDLTHRRWLIDFPTEHVHPLQEERWTVSAGGLGISVDGDEQLLGEGESVTLPADVPHRIWNPLDEPSRVVVEFHPALDAQSLTETLYVLSQLGKTNERGHMKWLQFAVIWDAHPDQLYLTAISVGVQALLVRLLAPLGRRAGYRATYTLDSLETENRRT